MIKLERLLCPTDLSTQSDEALRYAVALACAYDAKLILLHCSPSELVADADESTETRVNRLFTESLGPYLTFANRDLNWTGVVVNNVADVGKTVVEEARKHQSDLIVMRSRRLGRKAVLLGSTAETVSEYAPCPVLVTHPQEREWVGLTTGEIDLQRILVACDFSSDSALALEYGLSLAQEYQAEVHLLHVLAGNGQKEPELAWSTSTDSSAYKFVAEKLKQAVPKEVFLWCNVANAVRDGKVHREVVSYAKEKEIDLICMGASGDNSTLGKLRGSNVDLVLRDAPCPVFIARPQTSASIPASVGMAAEVGRSTAA